MASLFYCTSFLLDFSAFTALPALSFASALAACFSFCFFFQASSRALSFAAFYFWYVL